MAPDQHLHSPHTATDDTPDIVEVSPPKAPRLEQPNSRPHNSANTHSVTTRSQSTTAMAPPATCIASASSPSPTAARTASTSPAAAAPAPTSPTHQHATRSSSSRPTQTSPRQTARAAPSSSTAPSAGTAAAVPAGSAAAFVTHHCVQLANKGDWAGMLRDLVRYSASTRYYEQSQFSSDVAATVTAWHAIAQIIVDNYVTPLLPFPSSTHPLVALFTVLLGLERTFPRPRGWPRQRWDALNDVRVGLEAVANPANVAALGHDLVNTAGAMREVLPVLYRNLRHRHLAALGSVFPELSTQRIADELRLQVHEAPMFATQSHWRLNDDSTLLLAQSVPPQMLNSTIIPQLVYKRPDAVDYRSTRATSPNAIIRLTDQLWQLESGF